MTLSTKSAVETAQAPDLYRKYRPLVLRRALRFYTRQKAEDVVHEIFLKVLEKPDAFEGQSSMATWLYKVTTNHCLNRLRDHARRQEILREHGPTLSSHRQTACQAALTELVQMWNELSEELQEIAVYYYVDGMTHEEIARVLDVSRRTVGNRLEQLATMSREPAATPRV
jgi:RNA polymerase sigma-70 factor, ECF subfamily